MTPDRWEQIETHLDAVLERSLEERAVYLQQLRSADEDLYQEVLALLDMDAKAKRALGESATGLIEPLMPGLKADLDQDELERLPDNGRIGPYQIQRVLGRGGMGTVYLAQRADEAFHKEVALKIVHWSGQTDDLFNRFVYEREILASLDHPNIARLLDGGTTEDGRPYLVMEYIEGVPITDYCDTHRLHANQRLTLFRTVCRAVQFAHQNLIIHRDLKPGNILVTNEGQVKLLDFGIAKLLDDAMLDRTVPVTRTGLHLMTPEYASPEQVRGQAVTTASDVYQLGILLYELLTGHRPYRITKRIRHEIERVILEEEPTRPSTIVGVPVTRNGSESAEAISPDAVSAARGTTTDRLKRRLSGDLDNIMLMALRKEPERRYGTVEQFAEDIRRHLGGLPVIARRDTMSYRMKKFVGRHRMGVASATVIVALVVLAAVLAINSALTSSRQARIIAEERDKAQAVTDLLVSFFESNNPDEAMGDTLTVRTILERGAERIEDELPDQPVLKAQMMDLIGDVYQNLGQYDQALTLKEGALALRRGQDGNHIEVANSLNSLGELYWYRGDYDKSEAIYREALVMREQIYGTEHEDVAISLQNLGLILNNKARYEEAEPLLRRALDMKRRTLGNEHEEVATALNNLATTLDNQDKLDEAEALYREALDLKIKLLGPEHTSVSTALNNLAFLLSKRGKLDEAENLYREALRLDKKILGEHESVAITMNNLANVLHKNGELREAESMIQEALRIKRQAVGEVHPHMGVLLNNLAAIIRDRGDPDQAATHFRQAVDILTTTLSDDHPRTALATGRLGNVLGMQGEDAEAEALMVEAYTVLVDRMGIENQNTQEIIEALVQFYEARNRPEQATTYRTQLQASTD